MADGEWDRVLIDWPPRHGKSLIVSRLFTAYYLRRFPDRWVGLASYGADLAYTMSRAAREHYRESGGQFATEGVENWDTGQGGGMWAAGVGGPATGKGFSLGLIDDPLKNAEDAASETIREKQKEWYRSTFYTRQAPDAAIIVIQTRWHEDDLTGWLLAQEAGDDEEPERWHIVHMPAIAEAEAQAFPATCTVEPDLRQPGEALCPQRYDAERLRRIERRVGSYFWAALYQGRPRPPDGAMFKRDWFAVLRQSPQVIARVRYWDKAASVKAGAKYTAGVLMGLCADGRIVVEHVVRGQWTTGERRRVMLQTAQADAARTGNGVVICIEQEPGSSGLDSVNDEIRLLAGYPVFADRPTGDKDTRMLPLVAQAEAGNVALLDGDWNLTFVDELVALPFGRYRDQSDGASGAFNRLMEMMAAQTPGVVVHDEPVSISPY